MPVTVDSKGNLTNNGDATHLRATWKDWVAVAGLMFTVTTAVVGGLGSIFFYVVMTEKEHNEDVQPVKDEVRDLKAKTGEHQRTDDKRDADLASAFTTAVEEQTALKDEMRTGFQTVNLNLLRQAAAIPEAERPKIRRLPASMRVKMPPP